MNTPPSRPFFTNFPFSPFCLSYPTHVRFPPATTTSPFKYWKEGNIVFVPPPFYYFFPRSSDRLFSSGTCQNQRSFKRTFFFLTTTSQTLFFFFSSLSPQPSGMGDFFFTPFPLHQSARVLPFLNNKSRLLPSDFLPPWPYSPPLPTVERLFFPFVKNGPSPPYREIVTRKSYLLLSPLCPNGSPAFFFFVQERSKLARWVFPFLPFPLEFFKPKASSWVYAELAFVLPSDLFFFQPDASTPLPFLAGLVAHKPVFLDQAEARHPLLGRSMN